MINESLPPLKSLQAFEAAGRHESFLHAAIELKVSPGAISRHVQLLEQFLETELFVRRSNGVTLTTNGNFYARRVSRIFRDLRTMTAEVRRLHAPDES
ncbi:MAG: LysR family transcriptional regulator [Bacteroidetes bacterium SB0662_bin_6]|nr:LysR family transcriptional regulator [Bacteroidetes bacterium SB0662_bin_6]